MQARTDHARDIVSTNEFIMQAAEGQNLLNLTNALNDAINVGRFTNAFGDDSLFNFQGRTEKLGDSFNMNLDNLNFEGLG